MSTVFEDAVKSLVEQDEDLARNAVKRHLDGGGDPLALLNEGFIPGITKVGELFSFGRLFLPELIMSADIMVVAVEALKEAMPDQAGDTGKRIKMVAATVQGDLHDIGKGIGVAMYRANGWEVFDLGRDIEAEKIVDCAVKNDAMVIGTSALLTTTLPEQKKVEGLLAEAGLKNKIITMVAGAPVTQRWANRIGADVYAEDSHDAVVKIAAALKERGAI
jgi:trimethylamine corrinoid protein